MLVFSRKQNESVVLTSPGGEGLITVTVVEIRGGRVKLGIDATDDVPIHRPELWKKGRVNGQRDDRPQTRGVAAMDRWEDDSGGAAGPPETPVAKRKNGSRRQRRRFDPPPRP